MPTWVELREHATTSLPARALTEGEALQLKALYADRHHWIDIDWPSPRTDGRWLIQTKGMVGTLPLPTGGGLRIHPKVPMQNLFRMLERVYSVQFLDSSVDIRAIDELFDRLTIRLAQLVMGRVRRGLVKEYRSHADRLPYMAGRLDPLRQLRVVDRSRFEVDFQEHTADVHDNRVLAWTLHVLARSTALGVEARRLVARASYAIGPEVSLVQVRPLEVIGRSYDRLRADYLPMHQLCRLLLEMAGPTHHHGGQPFTAFVVDMPRLFERYVHAVLRDRLPADLILQPQVPVYLDVHGKVRFSIDLVVLDRSSGTVRLVLDTKYKDHETPATDDLQQAIAYAVSLGCREAMLVYPAPSPFSVAQAGPVQVTRTYISLAGELLDAEADLTQRVLDMSLGSQPDHAAWTAHA